MISKSFLFGIFYLIISSGMAQEIKPRQEIDCNVVKYSGYVITAIRIRPCAKYYDAYFGFSNDTSLLKFLIYDSVPHVPKHNAHWFTKTDKRKFNLVLHLMQRSIIWGNFNKITIIVKSTCPENVKDSLLNMYDKDPIAEIPALRNTGFREYPSKKYLQFYLNVYKCSFNGVLLKYDNFDTYYKKEVDEISNGIPENHNPLNYGLGRSVRIKKIGKTRKKKYDVILPI